MKQTPDTRGINELERERSTAEYELQRALLEGEPVQVIRERSKEVTELAIAIHKRKYPLGSPDPSQAQMRKN